MRRDFELDSLRSLYMKDKKSEKVETKEGNTPTEMEVQEKNNHHKGASTSKVHKNVHMDKEILNIQRREFVLDSLKSIYTKDIRKDFNLTTERNVNMTLYKIPFNFKSEDEEPASINETTTEKKFETTNISKGSQKLNAVLFKIPEIMSKINKTLGKVSAANHTFDHSARAVTVSSLNSQLTGNFPRNINLSAVNNNDDVFKNATSPATEKSKLKPNNSIERLLESKSKINMTKVQETTTVTRYGLDHRRHTQEDSGSIKSVIDLGVLKRLMEAARKNKKVYKIPYKTSTVDPPVSFGAESSERNFVNVWRETYLKPKTKLSQKAGALRNLMNKLDWKLARSDKKAIENIYGPAANQSRVPQFRKLWDFFWDWYYDPENPYFMEEYNVVYTNETASVPFNMDSNFVDPLLGRNHFGSLYKYSKRWRGHYSTVVPTQKKQRTPSVEPPWRRQVIENPEIVEEFRKHLHKRRKKKMKSISTSTSSSESSSGSSDYSYSERRDGEALLDFDSVEEPPPYKKRDIKSRNRPTTKTIPSSRQLIEIGTPRHGAFDKPILRPRNVEWKLFNIQNENDYETPKKDMRPQKVILLGSNWDLFTVPVKNIRKSPTLSEKLDVLLDPKSNEGDSNAFISLLHTIVNFNVSMSKPQAPDNKSVKNAALDDNEDTLEPDIEERHVKMDSHYELEGEETLEKDNKKISQTPYKKEEIKKIHVEPYKQALKRPEYEHDDDEHHDDYVRADRVQKENEAYTMQEGGNSQEELRPETVESQQEEEEKQEILNPRPPVVGRPEKQEKYVQQTRQERQEASKRLEKEQKPGQQDTYEQETRPNQLKSQEKPERAENSKHLETQETRKRPEGQGRSEEQGSTKEQWKQEKHEKSHGQQRPEWSEAQEKPERSEEQPRLVRPQVQEVPERQEGPEGYQKPESQENLESTLREAYARHEDHSIKYDKYGHGNQQKKMSQERPSRLQHQERLQKTEKDRVIKNERVQEYERKLIKFDVVSHDSGTTDHLLHSIKKNVYSGDTSFKKDTLEDYKLGKKYERKMKKPLLGSKEDRKLGKEARGWASGEKNKGSWEKNDKKNDDWMKQKDDNWDNKKDVDWDNRKDASWSNKKVDDWDKKKGDDWDKHKKDNWNKKNDDDWDKRKDDDLSKRNGDDWDKKKTERTGKISENSEEKDFAENHGDWEKPSNKNKDSWDKKTSKNDRGGSTKGDDDWGSPKKSEVNDWDSPKQSNNVDRNTPRKGSDEWGSPKKSKIGDWDSPKKRKKDDWDEPIKLKDDEWESPKKSKHSDWESPKKSKTIDWATTKKSNVDDCPKKADNDRGAVKKISNDRPKSDNNRQKANWERPPRDDFAPILPRPKYKKSKFDYGPSLKQYGYMHTPIPFTGKKVIYDE
ncbi:NK-tumor recognition protein-like [Hyposmocoma kahamanoa]|uniref:NK-tumor recognition protein-like n=1 Tax=Hyposmocoma kahamanoa TaxID=1477025 RepID=UPI000E6D6F27|nr:NK-tumor recognition protein-like [Hyposmocoma kahamanoa]